MGRRPCCEKVGLNRGPWTVEEDVKLTSFILNHGIHCWRIVPKLAGVRRCGKSCRLRWVNYLRPDLKRGAISEAEDDEIIQLHSRYGNRWSKIAAHFPGRTDNEIKNHWNTHIKKKLKQLGLDPQHPNIISIKKPNDVRMSTTAAEESKEEEEMSEACSNQSTAETDHFWRSFEMELTCSSQRNKGVPIQEEDVQNWIGCLESLLFPNGMRIHNP